MHCCHAGRTLRGPAGGHGGQSDKAASSGQPGAWAEDPAWDLRPETENFPWVQARLLHPGRWVPLSTQHAPHPHWVRVPPSLAGPTPPAPPRGRGATVRLCLGTNHLRKPSFPHLLARAPGGYGIMVRVMH